MQERDGTAQGTATSPWELIKSELAAVLAPPVYHSRIAPTRQVASQNGDEIAVLCPDGATSRWLERQLGRTIREIVRSLPGGPRAIRFTAEEPE